MFFKKTVTLEFFIRFFFMKKFPKIEQKIEYFIKILYLFFEILTCKCQNRCIEISDYYYVIIFGLKTLTYSQKKYIIII